MAAYSQIPDSTLKYLRAFDAIIAPQTQNLRPDTPAPTDADRVPELQEPAAPYAVAAGSDMVFGYTPLDTITSVRSGVSFASFKRVYDLMELSTAKWAQILGVSERTMQSLLKQKRNLDQNKSEKLMAFITLLEYAFEVLEQESQVQQWLHYESAWLGGQCALDFVDTFQGISMLREQLSKLETANLI